jgi:hypothetical protein
VAVSSKPVDAAIGLQTRTYGYLSKINKSELRVICNYLDAFPDYRLITPAIWDLNKPIIACSAGFEGHTYLTAVYIRIIVFCHCHSHGYD